jgi:thiol-disulfide isomerase/thioredoxin
MLRRLGLFFGLIALCISPGCKDDAGGSSKSVANRASKQHAGGRGSLAADSGAESETTDASVDTAEDGSRAQPSAAGDAGTSDAGEQHAAGARAHAGDPAPQSPNAGAGGKTANSEAGAGEGGSGGGAGEPQPAAGHAGAGGAGAGAGGAAGAGQGGGGSGGAREPAALCTGPTPPASAFSAQPAAIDTRSAGLGAPEARTNPGAAAPRYRLKDFQPLSCGYNATYGLEAFQGRPTLVALFASWCPYCQSQVGGLQQIALELEEQGKPVYIVVINASVKNSPDGHDPIGEQSQFVDRVTFPLLQDTDQVDAWALHGGIKDDLFVYRSDGTLQAYLASYMGTVPIDLTTPEGYAAVKAVLAGTP